ncbi:MAG TPA: hypothetical protein VNW72_14335 [Chthoniobacterales bacterium]|jgi:hypothetical protein|nr:hypothetical protein [Chthoniobacterales bacterium]
MKNSSSSRFVAVALCLPLLLSVALAADKVLHTKTIIGVDDGRIVIRLNFFDADNKQVRDAVLVVTDELTQTAAYTLLAKDKDGKSQTVQIEKVVLRNNSPQFAGGVDIFPKGNLSADTTYTIQPKPGLWKLKPGYSLTAEETPLPVSGPNIKLAAEEIKNRALQNKIEFLNGSAVGAGSARATYLYDSPLSAEWLHVEALGKADFDFRSQDKTKYFNSIVGQLSAFYASKWTFGSQPTPEFPGETMPSGAIPYHIAINGSVESDQTFNTVDATGGVSFVAYANNPITDALHKIFVPNIDALEAGVAPKFKFGYDYVGHVKNGVDTGTGSERLTADVYWSMAVARGWKLPDFLYKDGFDADFIVDVETVYAFEKGKFFDNSKLTLDFHSQLKPDKSPSLTFTYAQGKATPTFKHFDALLAGVKFPF